MDLKEPNIKSAESNGNPIDMLHVEDDITEQEIEEFKVMAELSSHTKDGNHALPSLLSPEKRIDPYFSHQNRNNYVPENVPQNSEFDLSM